VLLTMAVDAGVATAIAAVESQPIDFPAAGELAKGIASGWLILGMWTGFGAVLGFAFRSVALPVGLGVVWVLGVENLVSGVADGLLTGLRPLRDLLPGVNAGSLVWALAPGGGGGGAPPPGVVDAVGGTRATLSLVLYLAAFAAAGAFLVRRRDVT
jgi:ABC-2 type transport system permease protein